MDDIAHGLVAATEVLGNGTGMAAPLTGQQHLAAAHRKAMGGSQSRMQGLLLLVGEGTKGTPSAHARGNTPRETAWKQTPREARRVPRAARVTRSAAERRHEISGS